MKVITWEEWKDRPMPDADTDWQAVTEETRKTCFYGANWETNKAFLDAFAYEEQEILRYGEETGDAWLLNFQEWIAIEKFFGCRIDYKDYRDLAEYFNSDELVDGNILELGTDDPPIQSFRAGEFAIFRDSDSDAVKEEESAMILRPLTSKEVDLADIGPMYEIALECGRTVHAFYDELEKLPKAAEKKPKKIETATKAGLLTAELSTDPDNPGISLTFTPKGGGMLFDLAYAEVKSKELIEACKGSPSDSGETDEDVCLYVYGDPWEEDYSQKYLIRRKDVREVLDAIEKEE